MSDLLSDLYGCAEDERGWTDVLDEVCARLSARSAVVQVLHRSGSRMKEVWTARDSYSSAHSEKHDHYVNNDGNPRMRVSLPSGQQVRNVYRDVDLFPSGNAEFEALKQRLAILELGEHLGGVAELSTNRYLALVLHRASTDERPFSAEDEAFLSGLMPHARQAVRLSDRIAEADEGNELLLGAVDLMRVGVVVCDRDARILWANRAARRFVARSACLSDVGGRLRCSTPSDSAALRGLIAEALDIVPSSGPPGCLNLGSHDARVVQVLAMALPGPGANASTRAVLFVAEPEASLELSPTSISALFGLSGAEARLTAALSNGRSVSEYAAERGISVGTARVQLKRALAKTSTARQSELVRRVCASVAAVVENDR